MYVLVLAIIAVGFSLVGEYTGTPAEREQFKVAKQIQIEECVEHVTDDCNDMYGR